MFSFPIIKLTNNLFSYINKKLGFNKADLAKAAIYTLENNLYPDYFRFSLFIKGFKILEIPK